jgi:hypothetical protein
MKHFLAQKNNILLTPNVLQKKSITVNTQENMLLEQAVKKPRGRPKKPVLLEQADNKPTVLTAYEQKTLLLG